MQQYDRIYPGALWLDTAGKPIQAHGFTVQWDEQAGRFYWFGENKEYTRKGDRIWHWGVRMYTSGDFYNWTDCGLIIPPTPGDLQSPLHPTYCMDRPHIIYCKKTGKYVAWLKIMGGLYAQFMTVLTADRLEGPYEIVTPCLQPVDMDAGDFCLHYDAERDRAYIFFERPHFELICADLTEDFTATTGKYSVHFSGLKPPFTREAPTFFERDGRKFLYTSGTSGYFPNPTRACTFTDYHGEYTDLGEVCIGDDAGISFNGQFTSVIKMPGKDFYVACADRWLPYDWVPGKAKETLQEYVDGFADYVPDLSPKTPQPLSGEEAVCEHNTFEARYVWLPIEWQDGVPRLRWRDAWRVEDF